MKIFRLLGLLLSLFVVMVAYGGTISAAEILPSDRGQGLKEMPVLTGTVWQKMTADEKVAFVWGLGHIVTIEWQAARMQPTLKQDDLASKLAEGLVGM